MRKYVFVLAMLLVAGCSRVFSQETIAVEVIKVTYVKDSGYGGRTFYQTADGATGSLKGVWGLPGDTIYPPSKYVVGGG